MVVALAFLLLVAAGIGQATAGQVVLAWDPSGDADVAGYRIHYGTISASYERSIDAGKVTTFSVTGLANGQVYYFAATAYDVNNNQSGYSNEVSYTTPAAVQGGGSGASVSIADGNAANTDRVGTSVPAANGDTTAALYVTITSPVADATIRYTTDGTTPTESVGTELKNGGAVAIDRTLTIKAKAFKPGWSPAWLVNATYVMKVGDVTLAPAPGKYTSPQAVTLRAPTAGALIRYTTDGTTPSASVGTELENGGAVTVDRTLTLKAIACREGWTNSTVILGKYAY